jgi:hypothetical protein
MAWPHRCETFIFRCLNRRTAVSAMPQNRRSNPRRPLPGTPSRAGSVRSARRCCTRPSRPTPLKWRVLVQIWILSWKSRLWSFGRHRRRRGGVSAEARRRLLGRSQSSVGLGTVGPQARHRGVPRRLQSGAALEYRHRHPRFHVQGTGGAGTDGSPVALGCGRPEAVKHRPLSPGHDVGSGKACPPARHPACGPSQGRRGRAQSGAGSCLIRRLRAGLC